MVGTTHAHEPNQKAVEMYQQLISIFIDLSRSLESQYAKIADFQRHHL